MSFLCQHNGLAVFRLQSKEKKQACVTAYRMCTMMRLGAPVYLKSYPFPTNKMSFCSTQSFVFGQVCWASKVLIVYLYGLYVCIIWVAAPRHTGHCCCKRLEQGWQTQRWPQGMITTEGRLSMQTTHCLCSEPLLPLCTGSADNLALFMADTNCLYSGRQMSMAVLLLLSCRRVAPGLARSNCSNGAA